jgi:molecular chaperone Hsp33
VTFASYSAASDDVIVPFQVEGLDVRGRLVRLGPLVDTILNRHAYPPAVSRLLGELLLVAGLVGSALKFDGMFTVQTKGDGPIGLMVADFATPGALRGYAQFDAEKLAALPPDAGPRELLGGGYLALTIDQGPHTERYQGIVALEGETLAECAETYFRDSEQIATAIRLAVVQDAPGEPWHAGGIMIQHLPKAGAQSVTADMLTGAAAENWRRAALLFGTVTAAELTDVGLPPDRLLYRLFHEDGVRAFQSTDLAVGCRCSRQRIASVLGRFPPDERAEMAVDGRILVTCEFCNAGFAFDPDRIGEEAGPTPV